MTRIITLCGALALSAILLVALPPDRLSAQSAAAAVGIFEGHGDVGKVLHPGSVLFDAATGTYRMRASGHNMWANDDAFHMAWQKISGDATITADIRWDTTGGNPHKKAVLIMRQSLDADAAYADAAAHGDGTFSLQGRATAGAPTHEVQANAPRPTRLQLRKIGDYLHMSYGVEGQPLQLSGGSLRVPLQGPFYIGIGLTAHDPAVVEDASFSNVSITTGSVALPDKPRLISTLETVTIASGDRRTVKVFPTRVEAPNWTRDDTLIYNSGGLLYRIPVAGGEPTVIDTGLATRNNNDHGISPDGTRLAISDQSQEKRQSLVYTVPIGGGTPTRVTANGPSYWHGWSPDGATLAYVGERGDGNFDIYTSPVTGGAETRLTTAAGLDDGPDYSPDGQYIYFNSERGGSMQIWRMRADGSEQTQITSDDFNNWFPHPSPDGQRLVFLSYDRSVQGHPQNKDVTLRLMTVADRRITVLAALFGGQGTINVPSWSPDNRRLAFVSYLLLPPE
ncbi:MAG: TolB family protein [Acidobacteria bacterium]|nr:TolB family protein [Acidobacteriota bacterium]